MRLSWQEYRFFHRNLPYISYGCEQGRLGALTCYHSAWSPHEYHLHINNLEKLAVFLAVSHFQHIFATPE
ncbi:hypothetical protein DPMN_060608 [Dreissena polymorpha]|uniref:Uncharacterized protein n=1 Tax=Dreissena polymorpha TaxID=45954 RepID=A0A9D4HG76_DREPO|nr:hypothetical protein DPMN_060608 [Dreissena polymorpha]